MKSISQKPLRLLIFVIIALALTTGVLWQVLGQNSDSVTYLGIYPNDKAPDHELPTDLAPQAIDSTNTHQFASLTYGIHAFLWWDDWVRNHSLDAINVMRFSHVRQSFAWQDIEPEKRDSSLSVEERYAWAEADAVLEDTETKGIQVLARLDTAPFWAIKTDAQYDEIPFDTQRWGEFCSALATRYKGRIQSYQIWNEPNLNREWGEFPPSPTAYAELLAICATAIRQSDPAAIIMSAGLSPTGTRSVEAMPDEEFLWKLYEVKGFADSFDVLGVHAPGYASAPETDPAEIVENGGLRWQCFRHVEHIRAIMVANGDSAKQIAITEMGWTMDNVNPEYAWFRVNQQTQADYLVRAYAYAAENWQPWMGLMVTIYLPDPTWTPQDEQFWWALAVPADPPHIFHYRKAYRALADMAKISTNPAYDLPQLIDGVPVEVDEP